MQPVAQRVEHAVADTGELGGDIVRDIEDFLHALSVGRRTRRNALTHPCVNRHGPVTDR